MLSPPFDINEIFHGSLLISSIVKEVKGTSLTIEEIRNLKNFIKRKQQAIKLDSSMPLNLTSTVVD
jgi:hypothetical protein